MTNTNNNDLRLIEDYLPIEAISAEASREKSVRKGHISTLHLWWARRPLVACRAAVYGALVPADRWVKDVDVKNPSADAAKAAKIADGKKRGLNRKAAKEFVTKLCRYPKTDPTKPDDIRIKRETEQAIVDAQRHILEAHAERLTAELAEAKKTGKAPAWIAEFKFKGDKVSYDDIVAGRAPRPRVLDMFAGGGAIPLEALRLGCEAYALDLNPVAHIIQLCTLVYPQKYGKPDPNARGMTGPKNDKGETTWGGLAAEVRYWGNWVHNRVHKEIGDLYPLIPDPNYKPGKNDADAPKKGASGKQIKMQAKEDDDGDEESTLNIPPGYLMPVAYLWTRTVRCKNPGCGATVPLVRQTWLARGTQPCLALQPVANKKLGRTDFLIRSAVSESGLGFDPTDLSSSGSAVCLHCGTVADLEYVKVLGAHQQIGEQLMAVVCQHWNSKQKVYLAAGHVGEGLLSDDSTLQNRVTADEQRFGIELPRETLVGKLSDQMPRFGYVTFADLMNPRQQLALLHYVKAFRDAMECMDYEGVVAEMSDSTGAYLAFAVDKMALRLNTQCTWATTSAGGRLTQAFGRQALEMVWDFAEANPFSMASGSWLLAVNDTASHAEYLAEFRSDAIVRRGDAKSPPFGDKLFDAIITDPPYYDNIQYADLSDFFYVWLKRTLGQRFSAHFGSELSPKKSEAVASPWRSGNKVKAYAAYEEMMQQAFAAANRVLNPHGLLVVVYAHKTTAGWTSLVNSLRNAGFIINEAWPLDTELVGHRKAEVAALASSIFLIGHRREPTAGVGNYENDVQPELQQIVRERVETLWDMGIAGADLVIACVGAGLRAFTKYEKVEYANGEEVPAEKFLAEVEGVVLDAMLAKLSGATGGNVSAVDNVSRFYVLWRFVYKTAELDAGEAIVFSNGTHIELDGSQGLSAGKDALVEKKKAKYRARDFTDRGDNEKLGVPDENGQPAPLIDALHRILWLMENSPRKLNDFLDEARPDRERLRVLAQALAGAALSGKSDQDAGKLVSTTPAEQAALGKLLANWRSLIESRMAAGEGTLF